MLVFWAIAFSYDWYELNHVQSDLRDNLEEWVQEQEEEVDALAREELILKTYFLDKATMPKAIYAAFTDRMIRLANLPFALYYTLEDSLIYWNHGIPGVGEENLAALTARKNLSQLADGWYLPIQHRLTDTTHLYALIPIKYRYPTTGSYLQPYFPADPDLPGNVEITSARTGYPVRLADGQTLGYLDFRSAGKNLPRHSLALILFLLAGLCTGIAAHHAASWMIQVRHQPIGALIFLGVLFGLRILSLGLDFTGHFQVMALFQRSLDHPVLSHSIGDLLINISLLLWIIIFFYRELPVPDYRALAPRRRWLISLINYVAIACGLLAIVHLFHILVLDSDITFRFDDIFNFNTLSFLSLLSVQLLLIALFLYSYRILQFINQTGLPRMARLSALTVAAGLVIGLGLLLQYPLPIGYLIGLVLFYLFLFEFYSDVRTSNLTWIVLWMILFSGLASGLLFHFNNAKVDNKLRQYAELLIDPRDPQAEGELDRMLAPQAASPDLPDAFYDYPYLKHNYTWNPANQSPDGQGSPDHASWAFNRDKWQYEVTDTSGVTYYLERAGRSTKQVYAEILKARPFKGIPRLEEFRYALFHGDNRIQYTLSEDLLFTLREILDEPRQEKLFRESGVQGYLLRQGDFTLLITYESGGRSEFLSLFSYLFCLLTITLFVITLLNTLFRFLPDTLNFSLSHRLSLRNRIQFSVISLIVLSFLIIGMITIFYFKNTTEQYHQERLQGKALSVAKDLESQISMLSDPQSGDLQSIVRAISQVHQTDVDLYNAEGNLTMSSEPLIYSRNLQAPYISGRALAALTWEGQSLFIDAHQLGQLTYRTAYAPLPAMAGMNGGFLAIPYYTDRTFLQRDISEFISALLNVYVFLLFIAGGLAILVANSITYPISVIGEKLKQFKLGKQNQPLEWSSRDELGELIGEYNRMIRKLQESAELLARSEREGAWREMAKQVAHEIKNPLTPMKLSLQHLQQAFHPAREEDRRLLNRVSATLIEQIENLAQIASEFSNFAKIPEAHLTDVSVNELVRSVHHLFAENPADDLTITMDLPAEQVIVKADKNQLLRVLNNLVKNAIQAIPEDRPGRIHIRLHIDQGEAVIEVRDNGSGIPVEMQEKVFMPNFTTKSSGTGLGLAICRNIIDLVKGEMYFQTKPGKGTSFFVRIPVEDILK